MANLLYLQLSSSSSSCLLVEPRRIFCSRDCEIDLWRSIVSRGSFECCASRGPDWDNGRRFRFRSEEELFRDEMFSRFELGGRKKKKKDWWFDDDDDDDDDEDYDDWMDDDEGWSMVFEIFRALSWTLAPIGVSLLLGTETDSKAGLMALAIPLVQSLMSLVISKVWSRPSTRPMKRTRRETFSRSTVGNVRSRDYRQEENRTGKDKGGYKSWMVGDTDSNGTQSRYGGWDDLVTQKDIRNGDMYSRPKQQFKRRASRRRWRVKEKPFLWRMLIAAFPFLDSWTKMLY